MLETLVKSRAFGVSTSPLAFPLSFPPCAPQHFLYFRKNTLLWKRTTNNQNFSSSPFYPFEQQAKSNESLEHFFNFYHRFKPITTDQAQRQSAYFRLFFFSFDASFLLFFCNVSQTPERDLSLA